MNKPGINIWTQLRRSQYNKQILYSEAFQTGKTSQSSPWRSCLSGISQISVPCLQAMI